MSTTKETAHLLPDIQHHNLAAEWTFHYLIPSREGNKNTLWEQFLKKFHDFRSLEDFFGIMNVVEKPGRLPQGCRYYVFKKGIKPLWEDEKNANGQQIIIDFPINKKGHDKNSDTIANKWQDFALHMLIQDQKDFSDHANGIEFNNRGKALKIAFWYDKQKGKDIEKAKEFIDNELKDFPAKFQIKFENIVPEAPKADNADKKQDAPKKEGEEKKSEEAPKAEAK